MELVCCGSGDDNVLRCRNWSVADLVSSKCCGSGTAASSCPVVLISLSILKRALSKKTRGGPQMTFGIALKRAG